MNRYCVFLGITADPVINEFRIRFDPLASKVQPHVTLIHPFVSNLTTIEIVDHLKKLFQIENPRYKIGPVQWRDECTVLPVYNPELEQIRSALYTGILAPSFESKYPYAPHITIGRYTTDQEENEQKLFNQNFNPAGSFQALVLEKIQEDETSEIVYSHSIVAGGFEEIS